MKLEVSHHIFYHPFDHVSLASWRKYPNEKCTHVKSVDTISQRVENGILVTERLFSCRQPVPLIIERFFGLTEPMLIREVSYVDPASRTMTLKTRSLSYAKYGMVEETCVYSEDIHDASKTHFTQEARFHAFVGFGFTDIEDLLVKNFKTNAIKGKQGLEIVIERIRQEISLAKQIELEMKR
eukprot:Lithocolla_globosa_v1_NODE_7504_length_938_cov_12.539071.p1 type:complete len:182 gc:universal NODE_7504_length_938_cov_12.539071:890-345(-)